MEFLFIIKDINSTTCHYSLTISTYRKLKYLNTVSVLTLFSLYFFIKTFQKSSTMRNSSNSFIYILFTLGIQYCFNTNPEQAVIIRLETHVTHANTSVCLCVCATVCAPV